MGQKVAGKTLPVIINIDEESSAKKSTYVCLRASTGLIKKNPHTKFLLQQITDPMMAAVQCAS